MTRWARPAAAPLGVALALLAVPLAAQDGQRYPVAGGPLLHVAAKAAGSALLYGSLRAAGVGKPAAVVLGVVGLWAVAKGVELAKGHRLGPVDALHDLGWHGLVAVPVALGRWRGRVAFGVAGVALLATCARAAPRWC